MNIDPLRAHSIGARATAILTLLAAPTLSADPQVHAQGAASAAAAHDSARPAAMADADPLLSQLIAQSLAARPVISGNRALVQAERARIAQVGALPDPMLQLGIQNDGFTSIEIGRMPTSYYSIMASQTLPWPGKLGLQQEVVDLGAQQAETSVQRARLSTEADVRRAYVSLVLVRDRLEILDKLNKVWERSLGIAKIRYEAGQGILSDVMRSQLELQRLKRKRLALQVEESVRVQQLNRLRSHPLDEPIATSVHIRDLPAVVANDDAFTEQTARARSPEVAAARLRLAQSEKSTALAKKSYYPDVTVSAGIMVRGTALPPMWLVTVGAPVPIFSGSKQSRAVVENEDRRAANQLGAREIDQILQLRVKERQSAAASLAETAQVYRTGLLDQSALTIQNTLDQYAVGKVSLASVLEANAGYLNDEDSFLQTLADAQFIRIAAGEISLQPTPVSSSPAMGSTVNGGTNSNSSDSAASSM